MSDVNLDFARLASRALMIERSRDHLSKKLPPRLYHIR